MWGRLGSAQFSGRSVGIRRVPVAQSLDDGTSVLSTTVVESRLIRLLALAGCFIGRVSKKQAVGTCRTDRTPGVRGGGKSSGTAENPGPRP